MRLYTIFDTPVTMFACQVNQVFETHDRVVQVSYDHPVGDYTRALPGMTVWVGSAPGLWDLGQTYLRQSPTADTFFLGESSEIPWVNDLHLTVIDEFGLWAEPIRITASGTVLLRWDLPYSDQHSLFDPVPLLGHDQAIRFSGPACSVALSGSRSWVFGSTISGHAWSIVSGEATLTNANTATPTVTVTAPGRVVLRDLVSAANGKSRSGYRTLYFFDPTRIKNYPGSPWDEAGLLSFPVSASWKGNRGSGGYTASLVMKSEVSTVRPRSKVLLLSSTQTLLVGWLEDEVIRLDPNRGEVKFQISTAHAWLSKMTGLAIGLENVASPTDWTEMPGLTLDRALWHFFAWRTTVLNSTDLVLTGDTRQAGALEAPAGTTLWEQLRALSTERLLAAPNCGPLGEIYVEIEPSLTPVAERATLPVLATLEKSDYKLLDWERQTIPTCAKVELSGIQYDESNPAAIFSLAPGHTYGHYGSPFAVDRLLLGSQAQANELAALVYAWKNSPYWLSLELLRETQILALSTAPRGRVMLALEAVDTLRGVEYAGYSNPESVEFEYRIVRGSGVLSARLEVRAETSGTLAVNGDTPVTASDGSAYSWELPAFPEFPPYRPPVIAAPPAARPIVPLGMVAVLVDNFGVYYTLNLADASPTWTLATTTADWSSTEINSLVHFELNTYGRAYLASTTTAWSQVIGTAGKTVIGDAAYFLAHPAQASYFIKGIGILPTIDKTCALIVKTTAENGPIYLTNPATGLLEYKMAFYPVMAALDRESYSNYQFSYFGEKWYLSYVDHLERAWLVRFNQGLTAVENGSGVHFGVNGGPHVHAKTADYIYAQALSGIGRLETSGSTFTNIDTNASNSFQNVACDPTGQYLLSVSASNILRKSYDFGANWVTVVAFPHVVAGDSARILNLGDVNKWLVVSRVTGTNLLSVLYTADFGATWSAKLGNLATLTATTASVLAVRDA